MKRIFLTYSFLILFVSLSICKFLNEECSNYNSEYGCNGQQTKYPENYFDRTFQTPPKGHPDWISTYQDYSLIQGYMRVKYNSEKTQAFLEFITKINPRLSKDEIKIQYYFNSQTPQESNKYTVNITDSFDEFTAKATLIKNSEEIGTLLLDQINFIFKNAKINDKKNFENGQKGAIVEMFGWPYKDISKECEFLGKAGYMGVKIFPPNESILSYSTIENGELNPWWFLYQPVSYKFSSRQGTYEELKEMINKCRINGVRVYADAVINHMVGGGNDSFTDHRNSSGGYCNHWKGKKSSGGSPFYTHDFQFKENEFSGKKPGLEFPGVPYGIEDFHCERSLNSWTDPFILNNGWLVGLTDLNTESDYVRQRIADYLTSLLSIGMSGFRIDAAKHISPENLSFIFKKLKDNLGGQFPDDFITYLEVIIGGEKDLLICGNNSYSYGTNFEDLMLKAGLSQSDVDKIKIWSSDYPKEFPICGYWPIKSERYAIGLDCHDDQVPGSSSRDMGDKGSVLIKEKNVEKHRNFEKELFLRKDGNWKIRLILSSYTFVESKSAMGFPDGYSDCSRCKGEKCNECKKSVPFMQAYDEKACGYSVYNNGKWMEGVYTRVHRDGEIINSMRSWLGLSTLSLNEIGLGHCQQNESSVFNLE